MKRLIHQKWNLALVIVVGGSILQFSSCKEDDDPKPDYTNITISTYAGANESGFVDGPLLEARFNFPAVLKFDASDNLFVADRQNYAIRKITPGGIVSTFYQGSSRFRPNGMIFDKQGNLIVSTLAGEIAKFNSDGVKTTLAGTDDPGYVDGNAQDARFQFPTGLAFDGEGNLLVTEPSTAYIRKIAPDGTTTTFVGDGLLEPFREGVGREASLGGGPWDIALNADGDFLVTLFDDNRVVKITPAGSVKAFVGRDMEGFEDGTGEVAAFNFLYSVVVDRFGNALVADSGNHAIRLITPEGVVTTIAGNGQRGSVDGAGKVAQFSTPSGIAINSKGEIFVGEREGFTIRKIIFN